MKKPNLCISNFTFELKVKENVQLIFLEPTML